MKRINRKSNLIKQLFADKLQKEDMQELIDIESIGQQMKEQWDEQNADPIDPQIGEEIWNKVRREYKMRPATRFMYRFRQPLAAACAVLLALVGGYFFYTNSDFSVEKEYIEIAASHNMLYQLPDSSEVWMQPNSSIRFAKDFKEDRNVWLKGSSMFHVRKRQGSTFRVHLNQAFIEVRGTRFLVEEKEQGKDEITLFNGCIAFNVEKTGKQIVMQPMEQILYNPANAEVQTQKIENIEWQDGKFKFDAMPLNRLIPIINQMYHTDIVYQGRASDSPFSGTIRLEEPLDDVIQKICFIMNLKKETEGNRIIIRN